MTLSLSSRVIFIESPSTVTIRRKKMNIRIMTNIAKMNDSTQSRTSLKTLTGSCSLRSSGAASLASFISSGSTFIVFFSLSIAYLCKKNFIYHNIITKIAADYKCFRKKTHSVHLFFTLSGSKKRLTGASDRRLNIQISLISASTTFLISSSDL